MRYPTNCFLNPWFLRQAGLSRDQILLELFYRPEDGAEETYTHFLPRNRKMCVCFFGTEEYNGGELTQPLQTMTEENIVPITEAHIAKVKSLGFHYFENPSGNDRCELVDGVALIIPRQEVARWVAAKFELYLFQDDEMRIDLVVGRRVTDSAPELADCV